MNSWISKIGIFIRTPLSVVAKVVARWSSTHNGPAPCVELVECMYRPPKNCSELWQKFHASFAYKEPCDNDIDIYDEFIDAAKHDINQLDRVSFRTVLPRDATVARDIFIVAVDHSAVRLSIGVLSIVHTT